MIQSQENEEKSHFGPDLGRSGQIWATKLLDRRTRLIS